MSDTKYQGNTNVVVKPLDKGLGTLEAVRVPEQIAAQYWNVLNEDLNLPATVFSQSHMEHNLAWMQRFVGEYSIRPVSYDKMTMVPRLFQRQLAGGVWGIALTTVYQTCTAYTYSMRRVLMANQLVGEHNIAILTELLANPTLKFSCPVDMADRIDQLVAFFGKAERPIQVLIKLSVQGGRMGVRDGAQLQSVLDTLTCADSAVKLAGVEVYEGVIREEASIHIFLQYVVKAMGDLVKDGHL